MIRFDMLLLTSDFTFTIDKLSAFFILVINLTCLTGLLYARGYLKPYLDIKNSFRFSIHYLSYLWLYFSMIMVVVIRDGVDMLS